MSKKKQKFVSNVTGEKWEKEHAQRWSRIINQIGIIIEDEVHEGKNNTTKTLKKGSKVIVDDIRGRIKPQYRVRDINGQIWFVAAGNVEFSLDNNENKNESNQDNVPIYRGGVRVDGTEEESSVIPKRYEMPVTTDEELKILKENDSG